MTCIPAARSTAGFINYKKTTLEEHKTEKEKLNWVERQAIKAFIKKAKKNINKLYQAVEEGRRSRITLEEEIWKYQDDYEMITTDERTGKERRLTREDLARMSNEELSNSFNQLLKELEKRI